MDKYAGQKKVSNDIDKKLKKELSSKKANAKKAELNKLYYYAKLLAKNQKTTDAENDTVTDTVIDTVTEK